MGWFGENMELLSLEVATELITMASSSIPGLLQEELPRVARLIGAALAFGLAALAAGIGLARIGPAMISAYTEKPETFTTGILMAALAEAIAIYGIVMAILLTTLPV